MNQENTKNKIFYAAAELFAERCYAAVSVRDIAEKVGIKSATIHYYYDSKEEILDDLLAFYDQKMDYILENIDKVSLSALSPEERFKSTIHSFDHDERELMEWLLKIVLNEQFSNQKAADVIFNKSLKQRVRAYTTFFLKLNNRNPISQKDCQCYAELLAGIPIIFAMKNANRLVEYEEDVRPTMEELMTFVFRLARSAESGL